MLYFPGLSLFILVSELSLFSSSLSVTSIVKSAAPNQLAIAT